MRSASYMIWFPGFREKDITDDHVDATSRFVAPGSALVQVPHPGDTDIWSLDELQQFQILSGATDAKGRSIAVAPIQGPDYTKTRQHGINFVGSYANYYVCNGAVISQNTGDPSTDASSLATLAAAFPGRVIGAVLPSRGQKAPSADFAAMRVGAPSSACHGRRRGGSVVA